MLYSAIKKTGIVCIYCVAVFVVMFAMLTTLARFANPIAQSLSKEFTTTLESAFAVPVKIDSFEISWVNANPVIWFNKVDLGEAPNTLRVNRIVSKVDLLSTLYTQEIIFKQIILQGALLKVTYDKQDKLPRLDLSNTENKSLPSPQKSKADPLKQWLAIIPELHLRDSIIELNHNGMLSVFSGINLDIKNDEVQHKLKLNIKLPKDIGNEIVVIMEANGKWNSTNNWGGRLYLEADNLSLPWLNEEFSDLPVQFNKGRSSFKIWSKWSKGKLNSFHASTLNRALSIVTQQKKQFKADQLNAEFWLTKKQDDWVVQSNNIYYQLDKQSWNSGNIFVTALNNQTNPSFYGYAENINLNLLQKNIHFVDGLSKQLPQLNGEINNVFLGYKVLDDVPKLAFSFDIDALDVKRFKDYPGVKNYSGRVVFKDNVALLESNSKNILFDSNGTFRKPIKILDLQGIVKVDIADEVIIQSSSLYVKTEAASAQARINIHQATGKELELDIGLQLIDTKSKYVPTYLPVSIMSDDLIGWLERSIKKGTVDSLYFLIRGNMDDFPFTNHKGIFDIGFNTRELELKYLEDWPALKNVESDIRFFKNTMKISSTNAIMNNVQFKSLEVKIDDLEKPMLKLKGMGKGDFDDYKNFINQSPLVDTLGAFTKQFDFSGKAELQLKAEVDIDGNQNPKVKGSLLLENAQMDSKIINTPLKNIKGKIDFTEADVLATNIKMTFFDEPWTLKAYTRKDSHAEVISTRIFMTGLLDPKLMLDKFIDYPNAKLEGKSKWTLNVDVPVTDDNVPPVVSMKFESDLKGVASLYPKPLNKKKNETSPFTLTLQLPDLDDKAYINAKMDNVFALRQQWKTDKTWVLNRSNMVVKDKDLPNLNSLEFGNSIHQLNVNLDGVNVDDWKRSSIFPESDDSSSKAFHKLFDDVDIYLSNSYLNEKKVEHFSLSLKEKQRFYLYKSSSDFMKGTFLIPKNETRKTKISLEFLKADYLQSKEPSANSEWKMSEFPALDVNIKKLYVDEFLIEKVKLDTTNDANKVKINHLNFTNKHLVFSSNGRWWGPNDDEAKTNLQFTIHTDNIGMALSNLGFKDTFSEGKGSFKGDFTLPGSLMDGSIAGLNGSFDLDLGKGRIKNFEPGNAKVFGLLSIQALPKRLRLDFDDVTSDGFSYEMIKGSFKIRDGDAFTDNLVMKSAIGDVKITGRTGLEKKDYDQEIDFVPAIFKNLSVAGTLVSGLQLQVGLTILVVEAFLKSIGGDLSQTSIIKYKLTGTWDKPKMEVQRPVEKNEDDENNI